MDTTKTDLVIQFILAVASEEDDYADRRLGPIHIIKYAYLADLAYARYHGQTFTGSEWQFYHFGPWSLDLFSRIEPALKEIGAKKESIPSSFSDDDYVRWSIFETDLPRRLEANLPLAVTSTIKKEMHVHGSDTSSLLHHVYVTQPMLTAAPGERLQFEQVRIEQGREAKETPSTSVAPEQSKLSKTAEKKQRAKIEEFKKSFRETLKARIQAEDAESSDLPPPRYDEVFWEGLRILDAMAGEPIEPSSGELEIDESIWKSKARYDTELS